MPTHTKTVPIKKNGFSMLNVAEQHKLHTALATSGLILFPTDTIWGLGCDATDPVAVERVYRLKRRPRHKPFIILVSDMDMLRRYVVHLHPKIQTLLEYHRRPLTVIYEQGRGLAPNLLPEDGSIGIRLVHDPFCKGLITAYGKPVVATSPNISGHPFPRNFGEVSSDILENVDYVVKIRQNEKELNSPSVIIRLDVRGEIEFLRE